MRATLLTAAVAACVADWTVVFQDTFDNPVINTSAWTVRNNFTHGDQEWELYLAVRACLEYG